MVFWNRTVIATLVLIAVLSTGCGINFHQKVPIVMCGKQQCPTKYSQVANNPVLLLHYPGSKVLNENGWSANSSNYIAYAGRIYEVKTTATQLYLFYQNWLMQRGWYHCPQRGMEGNADSVMNYANNKYQYFYVAVDAHAIIDAGHKGYFPSDVVVYEVQFGYSSPQETCYPPTPAEVNNPNNIPGGYVSA